MTELIAEKQKFEALQLPTLQQTPNFNLGDRAKNFAGKLAVATTGWLLMHGIIAPPATAENERPVVSAGSAVSVPYQKYGKIDEAVLVECGDPDYNDPVYRQIRTMNCLTNYVRGTAIPIDPELQLSAKNKTKDVINCDFIFVDDHYSCGKQPAQYFPDKYLWIGENLAWGIGESGDAQAIFRSWMGSTDHRKNILNIGWDGFGVALIRSGGVNFWTTHFGDFSRQD